MSRDKTRGSDGKHVLQGGYDPAQPILPAVNLVRCLQNGPWCDCLCELCPPWDHTMEYCRAFCVEQRAGRDSDDPR